MPSPPQDRDPWRMTQPSPCSRPLWTDSTCHPEQHCYCVLRFAWPLTKSWSPVDTLLLDESAGTICDYWNTPYPSGRLRQSSRLLIKYSFLVHVAVFLRAFRSKPHPRPLYSCLHAFIQNKTERSPYCVSYSVPGTDHSSVSRSSVCLVKQVV